LAQIDFRALAVHPTSTSILLAAGFSMGPVRSEDGGDTWSWSNEGTTLSTGIEFVFDPTDPSRVYYGSAGQFYVSTNTGLSWTEIVIPGVSGANSIALDPLDPAHLFVGTNDGLFHSTDGGDGWSQITDDFSAVSYLYVREIAFDTLNPSLAYLAFWSHYTGADGGVYRSTNGGFSWTSANSGIPPYSNFDYHSLAVDPFNEGHAYVAARGHGIYKTTDAGVTWSPSSTGIPAGARQCWAVATSPSPGIVYCGNAVPEGGFYLSSDAGGSWGRASDGLYAEEVCAVEADPHVLTRFCVGTRGAIFRWVADSEFIGGGRDAQWERICADLPSNNTPDRAYNAIAVFPSGLYVSHGLLLHSGVFVSLDDGASCEDRPNDDHWTEAIAVNPIDPGEVYTGTLFDGVYESPDHGLSWFERNTGLPELSCWKIVAAPDDPMRM
jgi:photosystem II stability/assembly factor-like uncharacterized protein